MINSISDSGVKVSTVNSSTVKVQGMIMTL